MKTVLEEKEQFFVDASGQRFGLLLDLPTYERLREAAEDNADIRSYRAAESRVSGEIACGDSGGLPRQTLTQAEMSYQVIRVAIIVSVVLQLLSCSRVDDTTLTVEETMGSLFLFGPKYASLANTNAKPLLYRLLDGPEAERRIRGSAIVMLGYMGSGVDVANLERRLRGNYIGILRPDQWGDVEAIPTALAIMASRGVAEATELLAKMSKPDYWGQTKFQSFEGVHYPYGLTNEMVMRVLVAYAQSGAKDWRERVQAFKEGISDSTIRSVAEWRLETRMIDQAVKEFQSVKAVTVSPETRNLIGRAFNGDFNKPGPASIEQITGTNDLSIARGSNVSSQTSQVLQGAELARPPER